MKTIFVLVAIIAVISTRSEGVTIPFSVADYFEDFRSFEVWKKAI